MSLNEKVEKFLKQLGALKVGFATKNSLQGGPSTVDFTYLLREARSVITFAIPLEREKARAFLRKDLPDGRRGHEVDNILTNIKAYKMAIKTAQFLEDLGHQAIPVFPNYKYREDLPGWEINMIPELSLKLIAMRNGTGSVGFSGNIGLKEYGTLIILGGVVTSAELIATDPLAPEDSFCNECKLCQKVCALRMFGSDELDHITIGGHSFSCAKRLNLARCQIVCGGLSGLDKTGKWSTWSPGRYPYPKTDKEVMRLLTLSVNNALKWPKNDGETIGVNVYDLEEYAEILNALGEDMEKLVNMIKKTKLTCGNCQLICWGDPEETTKNYRILTNSGCVFQKESGEISILPPEEAQDTFEKMSPKHQKLFFKHISRRN